MENSLLGILDFGRFVDLFIERQKLLLLNKGRRIMVRYNKLLVLICIILLPSWATWGVALKKRRDFGKISRD